MNKRMPLPLASRAICNAAHSKNPISSKIREIIIMPINDNVAFHTMSVTATTSCHVTTPNIKANAAPIQADQPIDNLRGCTMTKNNVTKKITIANKVYTILPLNKFPHLLICAHFPSLRKKQK